MNVYKVEFLTDEQVAEVKRKYPSSDVNNWRLSEVDGQAHFVEVKWGRLSNAGQITVDGDAIKAWGSGMWVPREVEFEIGGEKATLVRKGMVVENWDLIVKGKKYEG